MYMKICVVGDALDVITCAKFQNEILRGYDFTGGRIFHFSYLFRMCLTTMQRYCAACDRSTLVNPPPVNPPNSLIRQNCAEQIHSHIKSTR